MRFMKLLVVCGWLCMCVCISPCHVHVCVHQSLSCACGVCCLYVLMLSSYIIQWENLNALFRGCSYNF